MTAVELIGGRAVNPGAGPAALTPNSGGSFTVRNTQLGSVVNLDGIWYSGAAAGFVRVRSPRLHDNVQGIKYQAFATSFYPHLDNGVAKVKSMPNDTFEARVQRAVAMMRHNASYQRPAG